MIKRYSIIYLLMVLAKTGLYAQCIDVRFGSKPGFEVLFPGSPQYVCLPQCLSGVCNGVVVYATPLTSSIQSATWDIVGDPNATIVKSVVSAVECKFSALAGTSPYDWGKARVLYRYVMKGEKCTCTDTLDFFKQAPDLDYFPPVAGPACLAPGQTGLYYVDPRFSRSQNLLLGIGADGYSWLLPSGGGNGIWSTPANGYQSGDNSFLQVKAPTTGWTNTSAILRVVEGNTCNTAQIPFTITRGNPMAIITSSPAAPSPYVAVVVDESYLLPTNSAQAITLTAPSGAISPYSWSQDAGLGFTLTVSGGMNETCVVTPNSGNAARSGRIFLTSSGCGGTNNTSDYVEIRRTLVAPANTMNQPSGCQNPGSNVTLTITNAPGGSPSNFVWSISNGATGWPPMPVTTTVPNLTVMPSANAQPALFQCQLNGQTLASALLAPGPLTVNSSQGYTFTMPAPVNAGANTIRYDILTTDISPSLPLACLESNFYFDWTYTGGTNANFTTPDGCSNNMGNIVRAVAGAPFGGGTLSVQLSARGPANLCTSCGLSCLQLAGTASPGTRARPAAGKEYGIKRGTKPGEQDGIHVFPNRENTILNANSIQFSETHLIEIFDSAGKKWMVLNPKSQNTKIDIRRFPKGSYLFRYSFDEGKIVTRAFEKK